MRSSAAAFASVAATAMTSIRSAACSSTPSRLARLKKLFRRRGVGRLQGRGLQGGTSIFLSGGDSFQPES